MPVFATCNELKTSLRLRLRDVAVCAMAYLCDAVPAKVFYFFILAHMLMFALFGNQSTMGKDNANRGLARNLLGNDFGPKY